MDSDKILNILSVVGKSSGTPFSVREDSDGDLWKIGEICNSSDGLLDFYSKFDGIDYDGGELTSLFYMLPTTEVERCRPFIEEVNNDWSELLCGRIGSSIYGDRILVTISFTGPVPRGTILLEGPNIAGPTKYSGQPSYVLILGASFADWINRIIEYNLIEYAICPGLIQRDLGSRSGRLLERLRRLNPGIDW